MRDIFSNNIEITEIISKYKVILCDVWGVLHNGKDLFENAVESLLKYSKSGGYIVLITNAPRPSIDVIKQLNQMGLNKNCYNLIVSSGDVTRFWLQSLNKTSLYHLGPERDKSIFLDLDINFSNSKNCQSVLCTGLYNDETDVLDDYNDLMNLFLSKKIVMHCANPDLTVIRGDKTILCAGSLAEYYANKGGQVKYFGKPFEYIYEFAIKEVNKNNNFKVKKSEILAIGDGLKTDILGAGNFGIDSFFIINGVHKNELNKRYNNNIFTQEDFNNYMLEFYPDIKLPIATQEKLEW
ncbi:TIGR01459 family HAD-type hydrolase [Hyphomicrobiales bacterium]|jgi:HAD superfamily hydrolase (TIGR01459 family)|nr:TIGR01459 family HAD-type hydrolase [Rhodobiaceae bacterium]MBT6222657.1 TIGR01459 family HAD-type hydrolase [Rhodobiaceae bacterium]MDB4128016.1 TIGR01459 family HAD-type hydrolase [Hyphomicrobiales bacterium]MDB4831694.1 TIGR01459 family HAD-type hydrolase [Hyphomicrobiales bacterium]MDC3272698.1 TIGR01459 family HAD-type hydrolase [Hyphomicrobiales bacterium]